MASSPDSSFAPDTDWLTAMGTGFPATTAKERRHLTVSPPVAFPLTHTTITLLVKHLRKENPAAAIKTQGRIENKNQKGAIVEGLGHTGLKESA